MGVCIAQRKDGRFAARRSIQVPREVGALEQVIAGSVEDREGRRVQVEARKQRGIGSKKNFKKKKQRGAGVAMWQYGRSSRKPPVLQ